jgi:hypothetical protein
VTAGDGLAGDDMEVADHGGAARRRGRVTGPLPSWVRPSPVSPARGYLGSRRPHAARAAHPRLVPSRLDVPSIRSQPALCSIEPVPPATLPPTAGDGSRGRPASTSSQPPSSLRTERVRPNEAVAGSPTRDRSSTVTDSASGAAWYAVMRPMTPPPMIVSRPASPHASWFSQVSARQRLPPPVTSLIFTRRLIAAGLSVPMTCQESVSMCGQVGNRARTSLMALRFSALTLQWLVCTNKRALSPAGCRRCPNAR